MSQAQQFEGRVLEDALQSAVDTLGPDVQVFDARRVRSGGVFGLFAKECFVVDAAPTTGERAGERRADADPDGDGGAGPAADAPHGGARPPVPPPDVDGAFARLIAEVEAREAGMTAGEEGAPAHDVGAAPVEALPPGPPEPEALGPALRADTRASMPAMPAPVRTAPEETTTAAPTADPPDRVAPPPAAALGAPRWSDEALADLDVPAPIRARVVAGPDTSDLEWTLALAQAIAESLPAPAASSGSAVAVHGAGSAASVGLLAAGVAGFAPGTLTLGGEVVVATASELALAVRACLPR